MNTRWALSWNFSYIHGKLPWYSLMFLITWRRAHALLYIIYPKLHRNFISIATYNQPSDRLLILLMTAVALNFFACSSFKGSSAQFLLCGPAIVLFNSFACVDFIKLPLERQKSGTSGAVGRPTDAHVRSRRGEASCWSSRRVLNSRKVDNAPREMLMNNSRSSDNAFLSSAASFASWSSKEQESVITKGGLFFPIFNCLVLTNKCEVQAAEGSIIRGTGRSTFSDFCTTLESKDAL